MTAPEYAREYLWGLCAERAEAQLIDEFTIMRGSPPPPCFRPRIDLVAERAKLLFNQAVEAMGGELL